MKFPRIGTLGAMFFLLGATLCLSQIPYNSAAPKRIGIQSVTDTSSAPDALQLLRQSSINPTSVLSMTSTAAPVKLGPGDLLDITVFDSPELTTHARITSEGEISFPLLGTVHVGGLSPQATQELISERLVKGDFVRVPAVSVFVAEYASQAVYVIGEVMRPGPYPLMGSHRLVDFISAAGGFTARAGKILTITTHADPDHPRSIDFGSTGNDTNPEINAGDSITISQAGIVYVLGDVTRPGGFMLNRDETLTVMQALALAEGTLSTAAKSSAKLIRTTPKGREEIPVNLKAVLKSKTIDLAMQSNDILFVPGSTTKGVIKGVETVLPAAAAASIYRLP